MSVPNYHTALLRQQRVRGSEDGAMIVLWLVVGSLNIAAMSVAGANEIIMSAHFGPMVGAAVVAYTAACFFISSLVVTHVKPRSRFTSLFSDMLWMTPLVLAGIAMAGYGCTIAQDFDRCRRLSNRLNTSVSSLKHNCTVPLAGFVFMWIGPLATLGLMIARFMRYQHTRAPVKMSIMELAQLAPSPAPASVAGSTGTPETKHWQMEQA